MKFGHGGLSGCRVTVGKFWPGTCHGLSTKFLARFLAKFLARFLAVLGKGLAKSKFWEVEVLGKLKGNEALPHHCVGHRAGGRRNRRHAGERQPHAGST